MNHGITDTEWIAYIDGDAPAELRDRIESHLTGCISCWEFYERTSNATHALLDAGQEVRRSLTVEDGQLHRMMRAVFAGLETPAARGSAINARQPDLRADIQGRLDSLETVLAPMCGAQAASRVLHTAARHSPALSLPEVTSENWEPFLERLTAITAAMCGDTIANLVWEQGKL